MKKLFPLLVIFITTLCSCVKHTEITIDSIDLTGSVWMAYEVNNRELSKDEQFMFYFSKKTLYDDALIWWIFWDI